MSKMMIAAATLAGLAIGLAVPADVSTMRHHQASDYPHPLNDAWLGLTVVTTAGEKIGYVVDAPFDKRGHVDFVLIEEFSGSHQPDDFLIVDGAFVERRGNHLLIDRSAPGLAASLASSAVSASQG